MSSLNLLPNPSVFLVQTGIFVANLYVVKKFMLEPYLKVKEKRDRITVGSHQHASSLNQENEKKFASIHQKLRDASDVIKEKTAAIGAEAQRKRDGLLSSAEAEAKAFLSKAQKEVANELAQEREKIPTIVRQLSNNLFEKTVN